MHFEQCPKNLGLYAIVSSATWVKKILSLGINTVQLRIKEDTFDIQEEAHNAIKIAEQFKQNGRLDIKLIINDHWKIAIAAKAYGVHLGQEDLESLDSTDLSAISKAGLRLGISTHNEREVERALSITPSYIAIGAIYSTTIKIMPTAPLGLSGLKKLMTLIPKNYPIVAIGGINATNIAGVLRCKVDSVAVISAIEQASNLKYTVKELQSYF